MSAELVALPRVSPRSDIAAVLARVTAAVDALAQVDVSVLSGDAALTVLRAAEELRRRADAVRLKALARVEVTRVARAHGANGAEGLLDGIQPGEAKRDVLLARKLDAHARVAEAMSRGEITSGHARVITTLTDQLPPMVRAKGEARLVEAAKVMDPVALGKEAKRVLNDVHPDGPRLLQEQEMGAKRRREFAMVPADRGYVLAGRLDVEGAAVLSAAIDGLSAPRPSTDEGPDPRTPGQRRGEALVEMARRFLAGDQAPDSGGARPRVVVTLSLEQLRGDAQTTAMLAAGAVDEPISAEAARRAACDATILPVALGGAGEVLDLGRERRTVSRAQRRALQHRDGGCAFPGCGRPPSWTDAHHIRPWARGGATDLDNLVLLCGHHHDLVHHDGWTVTLDAARRPRFDKPVGADPPRRQ
jgi:hypothetical protein